MLNAAVCAGNASLVSVGLAAASAAARTPTALTLTALSVTNLVVATLPTTPATRIVSTAPTVNKTPPPTLAAPVSMESVPPPVVVNAKLTATACPLAATPASNKPEEASSVFNLPESVVLTVSPTINAIKAVSVLNVFSESVVPVAVDLAPLPPNVWTGTVQHATHPTFVP
eukprot:TRINITY_DN24101_c0_g1_i1.p2 TRINITY_DN24101_c0_g1~~TRINITY_DN24101_c0_g1_i1.p2  ORF type:complete len:171 (+),score=31.00 TRINITY_DN24101_c0_g1_i1:122-634(+)